MAVLLLLLMSYSLAGEVLHEWIGVAMLVLFLLHQIWNRAWYQSLGRGKLSPERFVKTVLNGLLLLTTLGTLLSGLVLSQHVLNVFVPHKAQEMARTLHLPLAYWGFFLMSLHLGLHWGIVMAAVRRGLHLQGASRQRTLVLRLLAAALAGYGLYAWFNNGISKYLLLERNLSRVFCLQKLLH